MKAKLAAQGLSPDGDVGGPEMSETDKKKAFDARVKEIMRQKLKEKGIDPDATSALDAEDSMSEADRKKAYDARVKEIMRKKLAEKGIKLDDNGNVAGDGEENLSEEEKKKAI